MDPMPVSQCGGRKKNLLKMGLTSLFKLSLIEHIPFATIDCGFTLFEFWPFLQLDLLLYGYLLGLRCREEPK